MSGESPCVETDEAEPGCAFMNPKRGSVHWIDTDAAGLDPMDPPVVEKDMPRWEASEAASQLCQYAAEGDLSKIRKTVDGRPELLGIHKCADTTPTPQAVEAPTTPSIHAPPIRHAWPQRPHGHLRRRRT